MSTKPKFSRQVRNGKVVYVPALSHPNIKPVPARSKPIPTGNYSKLQSSLNLFFLAGTAIAVVGLGWLSFQVITDPDVAFWLNQFLPTSKANQTAVHQPKSLQQILEHLQGQEQSPGKPIVLAADENATGLLSPVKDLLIPIYDKDCSEISCQQIQSLHIYRSLNLPPLLRVFQGNRYYRLLDQVAVKGPKESELASLARNPRLVIGSSRPLRMSRIEPYHPAPKPGSWLRLSGLRTEGNATAAYGQVMYFHPDEARLVLMLNWASPAGEFPRWQQVTGDQQPELIVRQTVGLEPQFAVFQMRLAPRGDLQMEPISLAKPAFANPGYSQSLLLARSGLWSPAQKQLLAVKRYHPKQWSAKAQAQLDYINLHAQVALAQAQQTSASSNQSIVARLVNGEWNSALQVFLAADTDPAEVRELLSTDPGRLSARVDAFLAVNSQDENAIAWGTMIRHLQEDPKTALTWAQQKTGNKKAALQNIKKLLKRLDQPRYTPKESAPAVSNPQSPASKRPVQRPTEQPKQPPITPRQSAAPVKPAPTVNREESSKGETAPVPSPTVVPNPEPTAEPVEDPPKL